VKIANDIHISKNIFETNQDKFKSSVRKNINNKIHLLQIAADKKMIYYNQLSNAYDYYKSLIFDDLKKIKSNF
jgi:hypothetical protein